jgi:hypothetical protein
VSAPSGQDTGQQINRECWISPEDEQENESNYAEDDQLANAHRPDRTGNITRDCGSSRQRLANRRGNGLNALRHSTVWIPRANAWNDDVIDDGRRRRVGNVSFETVSDVNAKPLIVGHDEQNQPIVDPLAADLPRFERAHSEIFDGNVPAAAADPHQQLMACLLLICGESRVELCDRTRRHEARGVRYPFRGCGRNGILGGEQDTPQQNPN